MFSAVTLKYPKLQYASERVPLLKKDADPEFEKKLSELKEIIIDTISLIPTDSKSIVAYETVPVPLGKVYKEAETQAILNSYDDEPFYRRVCEALMQDSGVIALFRQQERFKNVRFDVNEQIIRDKDQNYFRNIRIDMSWGPRLGCSMM